MRHVFKYSAVAILIAGVLFIQPVSAKRMITPEGKKIDLSFINNTSGLIGEIIDFEMNPPEGVTVTEPIVQELPRSIPDTTSKKKPQTTQPTAPVKTAEPTPELASGYTLSIPAIGLENIQVTPADINNEASWKEALTHGVAQSLFNPGGGHKILIYGHSSRYSWDTKSQVVFKDLHKLEIGDRVYMSYNNKQFTYEVYKKEIVAPDTPSVLKDWGWEEAVFFTCWPENSNAKRIILYTKPVI